MKKVLKPFSIEAAKNGAKVVTRSGKNVRIKCYDKQGDDLPIIALINNKGIEEIRCYDDNGNFYKHCENSDDLMLEETKFEDGDILSCPDDKDLNVMILNEINENNHLKYYFHVILSYDGYLGFNDCLAEHDYKLATVS